jgi:histidine ammonia-lyase
VSFLNNGITPRVPKQGSVGYLTHMAHVAIALVGVGNVEFEGKVIPASQALQRCELEPAQLGAKDGLSLINGTPCMTGLASLALDDCYRLSQWADVIGAMSFEALGGQLIAFSDDVLRLKPFPGQLKVGNNLRNLLKGSQVIDNREGQRTQDALSIRSIPQIHGACRDQIEHAAKQINIELNSATDNPLVLGDPSNYRVISQANPHGEAVAMACDQLAIAVHELASVSERRSDRLVNPLVSGLPPFLVEHSGVNSGMMIAQYVSASLVSETRRLAQPACTDNFVTSALQEDHLSMGTTAALKLHESLSNGYRVMAIEYLFAAQAFEFFNDEQFGAGTQEAWQWLRQHIAPYHQDRWLSPEIELSTSLIRQHRVTEILGQAGGELQ